MIRGGSSQAYYRCEAHSKRGNCANALSVKEIIVRKSLLDELRHRLLAGDGLAYARKRIAERLGEVSRDQNAELRERRAHHQRISQQVEKLVDFLANGGQSDTVASKLRELEQQKKAEGVAVSRLERRARAPIELPNPDDILKLVFDLERRLSENIVAGREELRLLFQNGASISSRRPKASTSRGARCFR